MSTKPKPLLFISHKHVNKDIANTLRKFIDTYTGGAVEVYQSSSEQAAGPTPGKSLTQELKTALWRCGAFVMLYTQPGLDWSWCMYEYGVANSPQSAETKMLLFHCGDETALFAGQVNTNLRELSSVQKFVNMLLTDPKFFPDHGGPLTQHAPNGETVANAAAELFQKLQPVLPATTPPPCLEEWPAYPYLQLRLDMKHVEAIKAAPPAERLRAASELIQKEAVVSAVDKECARLFNAPDLEGGGKFEALVRVWAENEDKDDSQSKWVESLCRQVIEGARWRFPPVVWELMKEMGGDTWYAPVLTRVSRMPNEYMNFDIHFFKFQVDQEKNCVKVGIPES